MKYISSFILFLAVFLILLVSTIYAQEAVTRVRGNVYNMNNGGAGIGGLSVTVNCLGNVQNATTDSNGLYVVDYTQIQCPIFMPVSASVTFNGEPQSQTVFVSHNNRATIDFYFGAVNVPEFGLVTGMVAAAGSAVAYFGMKKKFSH